MKFSASYVLCLVFRKKVESISSSSYGRVSMIQTQEIDGDRGFILLPPQAAVLLRLDADSDGVEPAPCFAIQNCQSHYFSRCPMHGT